MEFAFLPNWLLARLIRDQQSRVHWNVILSHAVLGLFVISPLLAWSSYLPHYCLVQRYLGLPCPGCGITTSVRHLSQGDWNASVAANFAGSALVCGMVLQVLLHGMALRIGSIRRRCGKISAWLNCLTLSSIAVSWLLRLSQIFL